MANLRLYFEMLSKQLATTEQGPLGYQIPTLRQEDTIGLEISIVRQISTVIQPIFEVQNVSGWSLRVTVGTAENALATTASFTPGADSKSLVGELAMNTAEIDGLADGAAVFFEIIATNGNTVYGKRFATRVEKGIYTSGALVAPAGDTALGLLEANRKFVPQEGTAGGGFVLVAENGLRAFVYLENDGTLKALPLT